jgi:hypothetical protein
LSSRLPPPAATSASVDSSRLVDLRSVSSATGPQLWFIVMHVSHRPAGGGDGTDCSGDS